MVQCSSNSEHVRQLTGLHGETCYCLITDHYSGMLHGAVFCSKAPPVEFLNTWLATYSLPNSVADKYVHFDLGGELGRCAEIVTLFQHAGYAVEPTAPDSSHQNGPGEHPHRSIAEGLRVMLGGAALEPKFWPYAFEHYLCLYNVTVHHSQSASPYTLCMGKKPNLSLLCTFGCHVYALPPRHCSAKLKTDTCTGIFLGYTNTMKNVRYFDVATGHIKTAQHVSFDEVMHDLIDKPPNAHLLASLKPDASEVLDSTVFVPDLDISTSPFLQLQTVCVRLDLTAEHPFLLSFHPCNRMKHAYLADIHQAPIGFSLQSAWRLLLGSYIIAMNNSPIFTMADIDCLLSSL